ncbi:peptidyl-prolyl cis-trans isomerase [Seohaeicola nanhaiensis]|uniref:Parvulin-like PPIase n=1 Tax=Seohaeicola nanhaiensis TaxID=1387282 RepID=A0ABV9KEZ6_9RHOB
MAARVKSLGNTFVWIILALLIVGLAGFGATNLSGTIRTVGHVGDQTISVDTYARALQNEIRGIEAQTGQALPMQQVRALGLDQRVLSQLVTMAALDDEADRLGVSIGDENLHKQILQIPAFQGIDGKFDREAYKFALERANMKESQFETDLRQDSTRALLQSAITSGVKMPAALTDAMVAYVGARRSFTWALLDDSTLATPLAEPSEEDLKAHFEAHKDRFMRPETRKISYVQLTPAMMLEKVKIDDAAIQALYDKNRVEYEQPERRLVERLVFANEESANTAKAQIEAGGTTFEQLVTDRGLTISDVDLGDVTAADLGAAADAIFAAEVGDVVGPLPSDLGPALFRVNGKLEATSTGLDEVRDELEEELAGTQARRMIEAEVPGVEDMLAGGATLEDLARMKGLELGTIDWTADSGEGIAAYADFDKAAAEAKEGAFPEVKFLDDGGIFALRLDSIEPPRAKTFEEAREEVVADWTRTATQAALQAQAEQAVTRLAVSGDFAEAGLTPKTETGLMRTAFIDGLPQDFMAQVFEMNKGDVRVLPAETGVIVVRLDDVLPPDQSEDMAQTRKAVSERQSQALAEALFNAYAQDVQLRARPRIDERALAAVLGSFQ